MRPRSGRSDFYAPLSPPVFTSQSRCRRVVVVVLEVTGTLLVGVLLPRGEVLSVGSLRQGGAEGRQSTRASSAHETALCAIIATNYGRAAAEENFSTTNYEAIFLCFI